MKELKNLRTIIAIYALQHFAIPRPKALLGNENQQRLLNFLTKIIKQDNFDSVRFSAAGSTSAVFQRLKTVITQHTKLAFNDQEGDLLLRFHPHKIKGWVVLARITPRPLSARPWRVCNIPGGLNATLAVAMLKFLQLKHTDYLFNPMCGSGTLLIEACYSLNYQGSIAGCDYGESALNCIQKNLLASKLQDNINIFLADATNLNMPSQSVKYIVCNLPWGDAVGTNKANKKLYPAFLAEMARIAKASARMVLLSHDIKLLESLLDNSDWVLEQKLRVFHGGHYPRIYSLLLKG